MSGHASQRVDVIWFPSSDAGAIQKLSNGIHGFFLNSGALSLFSDFTQKESEKIVD
jgi:hypothetical protein